MMKRYGLWALIALLVMLPGCAPPALSLAERQRQIWREAGMTPAPGGTVDDAHFLRRIRFDLTGLPPTPDEIRAFLGDKDPAKRVKLIDRLLADDSFAVYQAHLWGDELRIKSEFPINLWPNAVQLYSRYVYETVRDNVPYDKFVRDLLTASGSNFRIPAANFFRASADRSPKGLANAASLTFFGRPLASFSEKEQTLFVPFFTRIGFKSSKEWKEEFVFWRAPAPDAPPLAAAIPGGRPVRIAAGTDPRKVLADEVLSSGLFAEAMVRRVWRRLFGREPVGGGLDVMCREMAARFRASGFDVRNLYREIALSPAYGLPPGTPAQEKVFAAYPIRRLNAEQISDRLSALFRRPFETYSSVIPEPFTFLPPGTRAGAIGDGSISSSFLDLMGKPPRDTGSPDERHDRPTGEQKLFMLNSGKLYRELRSVPNRWCGPKTPFEQRVGELYLAALSRPATEAELELIRKYYAGTPRRRRGTFWADLLWSLINSKEFVYQF